MPAEYGATPGFAEHGGPAAADRGDRLVPATRICVWPSFQAMHEYDVSRRIAQPAATTSESKLQRKTEPVSCRLAPAGTILLRSESRQTPESPFRPGHSASTSDAPPARDNIRRLQVHHRFPAKRTVKQRTTAALSILLLALAAVVWWTGTTGESPRDSEVPAAESRGTPGADAGNDSPASPPYETARASQGTDIGDDRATRVGADLLVRNVVVRDLDGRVAWRGDVDLAPALERIEAGVSDPHRNDGGVFGNREGHLPRQERGYYREYVVRTPGISHAGPQRIVLGQRGEVYYTFDHYESFRRIR